MIHDVDFTLKQLSNMEEAGAIHRPRTEVRAAMMCAMAHYLARIILAAPNPNAAMKSFEVVLADELSRRATQARQAVKAAGNVTGGSA